MTSESLQMHELVARLPPLWSNDSFTTGMIESLPGLLYCFDSQGKFLRWNRAFEEVSGYSAAEIEKMHPLQFIAEAERASVAARIEEVFRHGRSQIEAGFLTKSGTVIPYFFTGVAAQLEEVNALVGVAINIEARLHPEFSLRNLNEELEKRVAERTAELAAKSKELEGFCFSVSHDLKAPLRGIEGYSRILLAEHSSQLNDEGRRLLQNLQRGVLQMGKLIDDLLEYSRLERKPNFRSAVPLVPLVERMLASHREELEGISVTVDIPTELRVLADPEGLRVAFQNLLENAIKFSAKTPNRQIEIQGAVQDNFGVLSIRDNGVGFDMRFYHRIFEIFQRLHRVEDFPGTGIGLAMVRKAMERMGGKVMADSSPGNGARFSLLLPLASPPTDSTGNTLPSSL